jgi:hypothetical protein
VGRRGWANWAGPVGEHRGPSAVYHLAFVSMASFAPRLVGCLVVAALLVLGRPAVAGEIDPSLSAALHLKILSFDTSLKKRPDARLTIAVMYKSGSARSEASARAMAKALEALVVGKKVTVAGRKVDVLLLPADEVARRAGVDVVYAASDLEADLAQAGGRPVLAGSRSYLGRGAAIAVVEKAGKPAIVVHLKAAEKSGMSLDPKLLRLSEVIR